MSDVLYLAWRYLTYHRLKTVVLVSSIAIIVYLPMGLNIVMSQSARQLRSRAEETPLLVGAKGSPLELVLRTLYFETDEPDSVAYTEVQRIEDSGLATAVPIYARFQTCNGPIVATTLNYFEFREIKLAKGRQMAVLGECVIGSEVARSGSFGVGDHILSSGEDVFNIAGVYPLKMKIVGVLEGRGTADDSAVFVDLKDSVDHRRAWARAPGSEWPGSRRQRAPQGREPGGRKRVSDAIQRDHARECRFVPLSR